MNQPLSSFNGYYLLSGVSMETTEIEQGSRIVPGRVCFFTLNNNHYMAREDPSSDGNSGLGWIQSTDIPRKIILNQYWFMDA